MRIYKVLICTILIAMQISCTSTSTAKSDAAEDATRKSNVLIRLGMAYVARGQHQVAMDQYNKALKIDPDSYDAHTAIANLYENIGQMDLAQHHYKKAVKLAPDNPSTLNNYGKYLCNNGDYAEAEDYFTKAAETPLYVRAWVPLTNAGQCLQRANQLDKAEKNLRGALKANPTYAPALMAMAQLGYQQQKYQTARAFLQRCESVQKLNAQQLLLAVKIELALGDKRTAKQYKEQLRKQFPNASQPAQMQVPSSLENH
ncbi:MAG: type IV pilus biogenesis/stability protein PilW [Methylococcales bacterium]